MSQGAPPGQCLTLSQPGHPSARHTRTASVAVNAFHDASRERSYGPTTRTLSVPPGCVKSSFSGDWCGGFTTYPTGGGPMMELRLPTGTRAG